MDLKYYHPFDYEKRITKEYQANGVHYASDMDDLEKIANIFNATIRMTKDETRIYYDDDFALIYLNAYANETTLRLNFFHELGHHLLHVGDQNTLPESFNQLQERQASHFQLYAAMPAFLLEEFKYIENRTTYTKVLSEEFKLPIPFVEKRIKQIERRIQQFKFDQDLNAKPVPIEYDYSPETRRILAQLHRQVSAKGVNNLG
ncbi:ImmA/IrrE family metallo-endopeptidase [Paenibacillus koleovorans]|uniref:ImmA/IrrE family metallo-endopeptidase n=1 Tax=Paenibacillus koleovorans TaxID=121608 RepID=UPI000FD982AF|nr:ImmA/IrrE family metallo-endopeptidase [Paenibacillus koleovorans]